MDGLYSSPGVRRILFRRISCAALLTVSFLTAGCGTTLEDGYKPRALGSTPEVRRGYYASPFTDQAEAKSHDSTPALNAGPR
jgi:hypothetical protein